MSALPIVHFEPTVRAAMRADAIFACMVADAANLRKSRGHIDFADLRALGWTKTQLDEYGRAAAIEAIRGFALADDPLAPLSPDDAGLATIYAAILPPQTDLDDDKSVVFQLHAAGMVARDIERLASFVVAKACELRGVAGYSR
jgi:hypothetical protein